MVLNKLINSHSLAFNLFLENKISSLYAKKIVNKLSHEKIKITKNFNLNNLKNLCLVKDIPNYIKFYAKDLSTNIKIKEVQQYKGFLVNLTDYEDVTSYINKNLSKRNRKNLKSKSKKLNQNHNISSKFYFGKINKQDYNSIFNAFYLLLKNRFDEKKIHNRYLSNWNNLHASTYDKILEEKASLHVVYDDLDPIAITLNYHLSDIVFSHIQTYDVKYSKYNLGDICMVNHLQWLIKNNISVFDLSIGKTYYKEKWCNYPYSFMYHIFYNKKSLLSRVYANIIASELKLIQFLRDKNIIGKFINFDKLLYYSKGNSTK